MPAGVDWSGFDAFILGGSLHEGRHQRALEHAVQSHLGDLENRFSAFLSVSLAAASDDPEDLAGARECVQRFLDATGWQPTATHLVAGALRYTQYDSLKRWLMKLIAYRKGAPTDTSKDVEYTDWDDLDGFVAAFRRQVGAALDAAPPVSWIAASSGS